MRHRHLPLPLLQLPIARAKAVLDGTHLSIKLASADGAHRLAIEIDGRNPGVYQLAPTFETAKAVILLVSHGLPGRISPSEGELRLEDAGDGFCSGLHRSREGPERVPLRVRGLVLDRPGGATLRHGREGFRVLGGRYWAATRQRSDAPQERHAMTPTTQRPGKRGCTTPRSSTTRV